MARRTWPDHLHGKEGVSDIVQEVNKDAFQGFGTFNGTTEAELRTWILVILNHAVSNGRRKYEATQQRDVGREVPIGGGNDSSAASNTPPDPGQSPSSVIIGREEQQHAHQALAQLDPEDRAVIELYSWQRLSFTEIGRRLGWTAEHARYRFGRALGRLTAAMARIQRSPQEPKPPGPVAEE